jgi:hypothetical protein
MKYLFLILTVILASCASKAKDPIVEKILELDRKADTYRSQISGLKGDYGWISGSECDAVTFNSLAAAAGIEGIDIFAAEENGKWYRTPAKSCLEEAKSKSSCSRDNYVTLLHYLLTAKDLPAVERMIQHGEDTDWFVCDHDGSTDGKSRVYITPQLQGLIYRLRYHLGGADHGKRLIGQVWGSARGFEAHLQVLSIHLLGRMEGKIAPGSRDVVQAHRDRNPDNALFQAVASKYGDGDMMNAVNILLNDKYFPEDRLPEDSEYCTDYLFEREQYSFALSQTYTGEDMVLGLGDGSISSDWLPCEREKKFKGIDWYVAYAVATGYM